MTSITGLVLAGGRSTRFGADKLVAPLDGIPLVHHAVHALASVSDEVVVVTAPGDDVSRLRLPPGVRTTADPTEGEGPLAGLHAGLMAAVRSDVVVVAGADMPSLRAAVLREMLGALDDAAVDAVALHDGERVRPLPCALRTWAAADVAHSLLHAGRRRLGDVLDALRTAVLDEATWTALDPERATLRDVDTPEDLDAGG